MNPLKHLLLGAALFLAAQAFVRADAPDGKIHLSYWEKWSGAEENAMQRVVDQFNHSQDRIVVDFLSVGQITQKTLLATAGGDPPDVSGIFFPFIAAFKDRNALTPLTGFLQADGQTIDQFEGRYAKAYAGMGVYQGELWGVPSTPTTTALYWNKDLFQKAGLDPEQPPRTLAELESMSERLTVSDAAGNLKQVGFLPQLAGGWIWAFPEWFGGNMFDGQHITIGTDPAGLKAYRWLGDFSTRYGLENIRRMASSFGSLATPQDPFMTGQVAILIDGVWRNSYIQQFAPGMNYGVARLPAAQPGIDDFTMADADMLVIPRGAKHPKEAWEFLRFVSTANLSAQSFRELSGIELLCYLQKKPSPLQQWSPFFENHHPNPDVGIFRQLADSPHAVHVPNMGIWEEYQRELSLAFDRVRLGIETPDQALQQCQAHMQESWDWHLRSMARRKQSFAAGPVSSTPPPAATP
jgi:ABC-type glycerol-3-phosphate transport system substrate-binding protein